MHMKTLVFCGQRTAQNRRNYGVLCQEARKRMLPLKAFNRPKKPFRQIFLGFLTIFLTIFEVFFLHGWRRHVCRGCTGHLVLVNGELRVLLTIFKAFTLKNIGFFRGFWRCKLV